MSVHLNEGQRDSIALLAMALLALCLVFGGASQENAVNVAGLELAALPVLFLAGQRLWRSGAYRHARTALALAALVVAIPLLQLVPLPFDVWSRLPGRQDLSAAAALLGIEPWQPATLTPEETWRSALALLPPLAIFMATLVVAPETRRRMVVIVLAVALLSALLGAVQLASGGARLLYPYDPTNLGSAVGLFSNRNHLATLLLVSLPLAGALIGSTYRGAPTDRRLQVALAVLFVLIALVAIAATRSRAGILLAGPALAAALLVAWRASGRGGRKGGLVALALVGAFATAAVATFSLSPILDRFDRDAGAEARFQYWPTVVSAADALLPLGSGIGSFEPVFQSFEPPETLGDSIFNHAHNDYLEIWMEAGWLGAFGVALFVLWWGRRSLIAWQSRAIPGDLGPAASAGIGLMLLHSLADYPLRTEAMAVIFAFSCAILATKSDPSRAHADKSY